MYTPILTDASKKFGNNRWKSFSIKLNREVFLFSDLEYNHWLHVEFDPTVSRFCEQPFEIKMPYGSKIATSIPDMWKLLASGDEEIVEVKYSTDLDKTRVMKQIEIQKRWCEKNNIIHTVATDKEINRSAILLSNYKLLLNIIKQINQCQDTLIEKITQVLKNKHPVKISEISNLLSVESIQVIQVTALLIFRGILYSDLSLQHFSLNTEVVLNGNK